MYHTSPDEVTIRLHDKDLKEINFASDERQSKTLSRNTASDRRDFLPFLAWQAEPNIIKEENMIFSGFFLLYSLTKTRL